MAHPAQWAVDLLCTEHSTEGLAFSHEIKHYKGAICSSCPALARHLLQGCTVSRAGAAAAAAGGLPRQVVCKVLSEGCGVLLRFLHLRLGRCQLRLQLLHPLSALALDLQMPCFLAQLEGLQMQISMS
jgi:hypothetical protein